MILVRRTSESDAQSLFDWRNDEKTRAASVSNNILGWDEHSEWLDGVLRDPRRFLYVVEDDLVTPDSRVAVCRFDLSDDASSAEVSINLNPAVRGKGMARQILAEAIAQFHGDCVDGLPLTATIRPSNLASIRIFTSLGFVRSGADSEFDHYRL